MAIAKKYIGRSALFAFPLVALSLLGSTSKAKADFSQGYSSSTAQNSSYKKSIENFVVRKLEGAGYVANDNGYGPSKWGIVGKFNGLSGDEVYNLSFSNAIQIYDRNYWNPINADSLSPAMQLVAFNAAVNISPNAAEQMIADAHGNPYIVWKETGAWYNNLDAKNYKLYGPDMANWEARQASIARFLHYNLPPAEAANALPAEETTNFIASIEEIPLPPPEPVRVIPSSAVSSFVPEADAATVTPPELKPIRIPDVVFTPAAEGIEAAAVQSPDAGIFAMWAAATPFAALLRLRRRKKHRPSYRHYVPDEIPVRVSDSPLHPARNADTNTKRDSADHNTTQQKAFDPNALLGFTELERTAFTNIFAHHFARPAKYSWEQTAPAPVPQKQWRVDYDATSHLVIEPQRLTLYGDKAIEDTLLYAAQAWGGCNVADATDAYRDQMAVVAMRLIDEGKLPANFIMEGVPTFKPAPKRPSVAPSASTYRPIYRRPFNPGAAMPA